MTTQPKDRARDLRGHLAALRGVPRAGFFHRVGPRPRNDRGGGRTPPPSVSSTSLVLWNSALLKLGSGDPPPNPPERTPPKRRPTHDFFSNHTPPFLWVGGGDNKQSRACRFFMGTPLGGVTLTPGCRSDDPPPQRHTEVYNAAWRQGLEGRDQWGHPRVPSRASQTGGRGTPPLTSCLRLRNKSMIFTYLSTYFFFLCQSLPSKCCIRCMHMLPVNLTNHGRSPPRVPHKLLFFCDPFSG